MRIEPWDGFADKLQKTAERFFPVFASHHAMLAPDDPKTWALLLLARTASSFDTVRFLLANSRIVEARTITRCCNENLFWLAALSKRGAEFVKEMHADNEHWTLKHANRVLEWVGEQERTFDFTASLREGAIGLKNRKAGRPIKHDAAAKQGDISVAYISYGQLSVDAAHPSVTSLERHLTWESDRDDCKLYLHAPVLPWRS